MNTTMNKAGPTSDLFHVFCHKTGNKRLYQDFSCIKIQFMKAETAGEKLTDVSTAGC